MFIKSAILALFLLIIIGFNSYSQSEELNYQLLNSVFDNNIEKTDSLLKLGADINFVDLNNTSCLHFAVWNANFKMTEYLLEKGAKTELKDENGLTPLLLACSSGSDSLINLLLFFGADIHAVDHINRNSVFLSVLSGNLIALDMLLYYGANSQTQNIEGISPLMLAIQEQRNSMAELLIKTGINNEIVDSGGNNALFYAVKYGNKEILQKLFQNVQNLYIRNKQGMNVYELAVTIGDTDVIDLLKPKFLTQEINSELLWRQYFINRNKSMKKRLKDASVQRPKNLIFGGIQNETGFQILKSDFFAFNTIFLCENNYNLKFGLGFGSNLWRNSEYFKINNEKYKFHTYRNFTSLHAVKVIHCFSDAKQRKIDTELGCMMSLDYLNFRGINYTPPVQLALVPQCIIRVSVKNIGYSAGLMYWKDKYVSGNFRFCFTVSYLFNAK